MGHHSKSLSDARFPVHNRLGSRHAPSKAPNIVSGHRKEAQPMKCGRRRPVAQAATGQEKRRRGGGKHPGFCVGGVMVISWAFFFCSNRRYRPSAFDRRLADRSDPFIIIRVVACPWCVND